VRASCSEYSDPKPKLEWKALVKAVLFLKLGPNFRFGSALIAIYLAETAGRCLARPRGSRALVNAALVSAPGSGGFNELAVAKAAQAPPFASQRTIAEAAVDGAVLADLREGHARIGGDARAGEARVLALARLLYTGSDVYRGLARRGTAQFGERARGDPPPANCGVAADGTLVWVYSAGFVGASMWQLALCDRAGKLTPLALPPASTKRRACRRTARASP
jgi:hypothetical protein